MRNKTIFVLLIAFFLFCFASILQAIPIQWSLEDGGNEHWYEAVAVPESISWPEADVAASAAGGYLVTVTSSQENAFVFNLINDDAYWYFVPFSLVSGGSSIGPFIGGYQLSGSAEPSGGWTWVTGEPFSYTNWRVENLIILRITKTALFYGEKGLYTLEFLHGMMLPRFIEYGRTSLNTKLFPNQPRSYCLAWVR